MSFHFSSLTFASPFDLDSIVATPIRLASIVAVPFASPIWPLSPILCILRVSIGVVSKVVISSEGGIWQRLCTGKFYLCFGCVLQCVFGCYLAFGVLGVFPFTFSFVSCIFGVFCNVAVFVVLGGTVV